MTELFKLINQYSFTKVIIIVLIAGSISYSIAFYLAIYFFIKVKKKIFKDKNPHWRYVVTFADIQKTNHSAKLWKILN